MGKQTVLFDEHKKANAKIVDFSGWDMPIHYGSQIEEHHQVRQDCGVFDVSHMTVVDISGEEATAFLRYLLANDVAKLKEPGKALYSAMLRLDGGVIDDLVIYSLGSHYRMVVNCATKDKDLAWIEQQSKKFQNILIDQHDDLAILAIQGPNARKKVAAIFDGKKAEIINNLKVFQGKMCEGWLIARTGYTGEDGLEIILPQNEAATFWKQLIAADISPIGLGARDTLRLEACMNLYGADMDESVTPLESAMAWTVSFDDERDFVGKGALLAQKKQGLKSKLVALVLEQKGILRSQQKVVLDNGGVGEITSGTYSPTLSMSVALARVPIDAKGDCQVEMRGKLLPVRIVKAPFVRNGQKAYQ